MTIIQKTLPKIHNKPEVFFSWLDWSLLLLLTAFILSGITLVPFHADEATYIFMSRDYDVIVKEGDLGAFLLNTDTETEIADQGIRLSTGSTLSFLIGFVRDTTGMSDGLNKNWRWGYSWSDNIQQGNMPNRQLLTLARACSALTGALSIAFFFLTAHLLLGSRLSAWFAAIILATNGGILVNFRRAMQEGPKFLFLIITLYLASSVLKTLKSRRLPISMYVFLGLASGLTLATKQDTVPMLMAIYLALALAPVLRKETGQIILSNVFYLGASTALAFASFLILMPIFWGWWETAFVLAGFATLLFQIPAWDVSKAAKPLALAGCVLIIWMTAVSPTLWYRFYIPFSKMTEVRKWTMERQVEYLISNNLFYFNTIENKASFFLASIMKSGATYMEVKAFDIDPINEQIAIYETSYLEGRIETPIFDLLIAILFFIGAFALFRRWSLESLLIFSMLFITGVVLFILVPLPWQRYFLIMQIPYSLIAGAGAREIWAWITKVVHQPIMLKK